MKNQKMSLVLRLAIVKEKISETEFIVEDIFSGEMIEMSISGKLRMNYFRVEVGEEVYVTMSPYTPNCGMFTSATCFKRSDMLYGEKLKLDAKRKARDNSLIYRIKMKYFSFFSKKKN